MSLTKKDPSLRVAATDPHLVSLGGGRLSTAVTIHYIQIGDTTIGSSKACSISLNGSGVRAVHCTIYRSECNEVTIVPELDARILIDGAKITEETNLTQGAMITIGNSNYLRFNNPDEAMMMRSAIGSNERISMPQIDFTQVSNKIGNATKGVTEAPTSNTLELEAYFETVIQPSLGASQMHSNQQQQQHQQQQLQEQLMSKSLMAMPTSAAAAAAAANTGGSGSGGGGLSKSSYKHISSPIDINGMQCPKVFTADLITVNMPAKDVLGQKYASFAKNLAENHRNEKHMNNTSKSNQLSKSLTQQNGDSCLTHIPSATNNCIQMQIQQQQQQQQQLHHHPHPHHQHHMPSASSSSTTSVALAKYKLNATTGGSMEPLLTKVQNTSGSTSTSTSTAILRGQQQQQQHHQPAPVNLLHNHHHLQIHQLQQPHPAHQNHVKAYDRYPKPGTYGGLQIYPMNGINTEINNLSHTETDMLEDMLKICTEYANQSSPNSSSNIINVTTTSSNNNNNNNLNSSHNSMTSSPIVQNRIKTNGSLPREKKSPFHHDLSSAQWHSGSSGNLAAKQSLNCSSAGSGGGGGGVVISSSSGYENVCLLGPNRVEINGQTANKPNANNAAGTGSVTSKSGYENVNLIGNAGAAAAANAGKYVPQSPRTKIRTTCMSPKKDTSFGSSFGLATPPAPKSMQQPPVVALKPLAKQREYEQLIKSFERRLQLEMKAIEESSRYQSQANQAALNAAAAITTTTAAGAAAVAASASSTPSKRANKNINNLTLNLQQHSHSLQNSPKLSKKPTPAPRMLNKSLPANATGSAQSLRGAPDEVNVLPNCRDKDKDRELKRNRLELKSRIAHLRNEIAELQTQAEAPIGDEQQLEESSETRLHKLQSLQMKIHRLEAQRNATRVMEENQQAKLKQTIEMKQEQVKKLKAMLMQKPNNECLKEELEHVSESLESDRKTFEDLEFQYFEEESEFHACYEDLKRVEKRLTLENELATCMERLSGIDALNGGDHDASAEHDNAADSIDDFVAISPIRASKPIIADASIQRSNLVNGVMSQSLFGSAELLCPKRATEDIMSKSVNENLVFNHKIELPRADSNATNTQSMAMTSMPSKTSLTSTSTPTATVITSASTPKRAQFQVFDIDVSGDNGTGTGTVTVTVTGPDTGGSAAAAAAVAAAKCQTNNEGAKQQVPNDSVNNISDESVNIEGGIDEIDREQVPFNLSLRGERFAVNALERRVPSQDDIDRSCKVASDAPISAGRSPSTKIFDSIKEIERNRKLLLAQQGHHVIEHERQKMCDLKKKSHDEARTQYLRTMNASKDNIETLSIGGGTELTALEQLKPTAKKLHENANKGNNVPLEHNNNNNNNKNKDKQQRHSQPELELQSSLLSATPPPLLPRTPRPLSEANSEHSCELLETTNSAGRALLHAGNSIHSDNAGGDGLCAIGGAADVNKRASTNSNETKSAGSSGSGSGSGGGGGASAGAGGERKRMLPKHQRPLTRYLPIFSPDLNLRHHIESAGHQIDLCPHVFVDAHSCRGYLHKLGATFHAWSRRWFVLDRQRSVLIYYSDKSERKPRGGAYFATIDEVYLDHLNASKSGRPHCTFIVKTKKRSYNLQAASDAAARIWIDAIITGAQGNLDY